MTIKETSILIEAFQVISEHRILTKINVVESNCSKGKDSSIYETLRSSAALRVNDALTSQTRIQA